MLSPTPSPKDKLAIMWMLGNTLLDPEASNKFLLLFGTGSYTLEHPPAPSLGEVTPFQRARSQHVSVDAIQTETKSLDYWERKRASRRERSHLVTVAALFAVSPYVQGGGVYKLQQGSHSSKPAQYHPCTLCQPLERSRYHVLR